MNAPTTKSDSVPSGAFAAPTRDLETQWYVAQTRAQHEKRVSEQLGRRSIESFLPLYERISRWKDRRVRLQVPLFAGYVFVRLNLRERFRVLEIPGVAWLVGFAGVPTALPEAEVESIRHSLKFRLRAEPCPYLAIGQRVRVDRGPLQGVEGIFVRRKNCLRLVLSVALIQRSIAVEVDATDISRAPA